MLIMFFINLKAQEISYAPLQCEGPIPEDFLQLSSEKVLKANEQINSKKLSDKEKSIQTEFVFKSNYKINQILMSGQVLYGDPLTKYINKLADILLKQDPELRSQLRFYTLKSTLPNAFSTAQGIIFVTTGLLAQVENEAQLAFILCHEIAHYNLKHTYIHFKAEKNLGNLNGNNRGNFEQTLKKLNSYSKAHELEADKRGFELYSKTNYSPSQAIKSFDMLLYSYLPFDEIEWSPSYFEDSFFLMPKRFYLNEVKEISADEDENDENSTHPNLLKRKTALMELLDTLPNSSNLFLTTEGYFETMQHQVRIEIAYNYIILTAYEKAFYHAYLLEKKYQDYDFSNQIKAMALYGIYKHKLALDNFKYGNYKDCEGESQRVYYLLNEISGIDLNIIACRQIWEYYLKDKQNQFLKTLARESLNDVFGLSKKSRTYFLTKTKPEKLPNIEDSESTKETKVDKVKKRKKQTSIEDSTSFSSDFTSSAFINLFKVNEFERALKIASVSKAEVVPIVKLTHAEKLKAKEKIKNHGVALGIDTLIMLNPTYTGPSSKSNQAVMKEEEEKEIYLAEIYKSLAKSNRLHLTILNTLDKENLNTSAWNSFMLFNQWMTERINNDTLSMQLFFKTAVLDLSRSYNSNYLAISGFRSTGGLGFNITSNNNFTYYMALFDLSTSKLTFYEYKTLTSKVRPEVLKSLVYSTFYQLKAKPKK